MLLWSKVEEIYSEHCIKFQFVISLPEETNKQVFPKCLRKSQGWFAKYQWKCVTNATQIGEIGKTGRMSLTSLLIWFFWAWWRWDAAMVPARSYRVAKVPWWDVAEHAGIWTRISLSLILLKKCYLVKMQNSSDFGSRQRFARWKHLFVSAGISYKAFFFLIHFSFQIEHVGSRPVHVMFSPVPFGHQKPHQAGDLWVAGNRCFIFCYYISDDERRTTDFHGYESSRKTACG